MALSKKRKLIIDENGNDPNSVLVVGAHSDDQIFGPGGTVAKYAKEGKKIHTIIFSYGEMSMPIHQREYAVRKRVKESLDVDKFLGGYGVTFLGLDEGKFSEQFEKRKMYPKLKKLILKYRPSIIFTHSVDDPLPDHRALNKVLLETIDRMRYKCDVYMFDVWNVFNFKKRHYVKIIVDISQTFDMKIKALKMFDSQKLSMFSLMWSVYLRAWINGRDIKVKYAEVFYKIR
ncbi:MAG: PIG-L deacetylase family protein [Candidatus Woesearchaeota archaeon]